LLQGNPKTGKPESGVGNRKQQNPESTNQRKQVLQLSKIILHSFRL